MKKYLLILVAVFSFECALFAQTATNTVSVTNLSAERFKAIIANDKNGTIIDLRTTDEISKGYIKGSIQIDFLAKDAKQKIDKLAKNKTYYIYCSEGGKCADDAAAYMSTHNFKHIYILENGFFEWEKKGFPVEKK